MFEYKKYIKGFRNQLGVIDALLFREMLTKKSFSYLGFFGVLIEPLILTLAYIILLKLIRVSFDMGINIFSFFATGLLIFSFFISTITRSINAIRANKNLFYYKRLKPIDTVIARTFIEISLTLTTYTLILLIIFYAQNKITLDNLPLLLFVFTLVTVLAFSVGLILLIIGNKLEYISNWLPLISRPLFFTSGAIIPLSIVPSNFQYLVLWNPLLHASELARNSLDNNYILNNQISLKYLSYITFVIFWVALFIYQRNEKYLMKK